jgi:hypothetical protein
MEFGTGVLYRKFVEQACILKNWRCDSHILLKGVNEFSPFLRGLGEICA